MRPTPTETIQGVVRILRDTVAPAIGDDHASGQLAQVIAVLGQVAWDDAAFLVAREAGAIDDLLADCRAWVDDDPARQAAFGPVASGSPLTPSLSFEDANARQQAGRRALAQFIAELRTWRSDRGPESSQILFDHIGTTLAR